MATILKGILGGFSGLVGTVIGSSWRGLDVIKSRPKKSGKAPVQAQKDQQFKFALMTQFLTRAKIFIDLGFKSDGKAYTTMNVAVTYNLANAIVGASPIFSIDYTKLKLADGKLPEASNVEVTPAANRNLNFTWDEYVDQDGLEANTLLRNTDKLNYLYFNPATNKSLRGVLSGARGAMSDYQTSNGYFTIVSYFLWAYRQKCWRCRI